MPWRDRPSLPATCDHVLAARVWTPPAPFHGLSRLFAASCASYNFSFLSPQGLGLASQGSSAPFWSGTAAARGVGGPARPSCLLAHSPGLEVSAATGGRAGGTGKEGAQRGGWGRCSTCGHNQAWRCPRLWPAHPMTTPQPPATVPHCSPGALPLAAANSRVATLGVKGGADPGRASLGGSPEDLGDLGAEGQVLTDPGRSAVCCQIQSSPSSCVFPLPSRSLSSAHQDSWVPAGPVGFPVWLGSGIGHTREVGHRGPGVQLQALCHSEGWGWAWVTQLPTGICWPCTGPTGELPWELASAPIPTSTLAAWGGPRAGVVKL